VERAERVAAERVAAVERAERVEAETVFRHSWYDGQEDWWDVDEVESRREEELRRAQEAQAEVARLGTELKSQRNATQRAQEAQAEAERMREREREKRVVEEMGKSREVARLGTELKSQRNATQRAQEAQAEAERMGESERRKGVGYLMDFAKAKRQGASHRDMVKELQRQVQRQAAQAQLGGGGKSGVGEGGEGEEGGEGGEGEGRGDEEMEEEEEEEEIGPDELDPDELEMSRVSPRVLESEMIKATVIGRDADLHLMPTKEQLDAAILTPPQQQELIQEQLGDFAASNLDGQHGQSLQHLIAVNNGGAQCSKFNFGPHPIPSSLNATLNASMDDVVRAQQTSPPHRRRKQRPPPLPPHPLFTYAASGFYRVAPVSRRCLRELGRAC
jgi:hypothetical protein